MCLLVSGWVQCFMFRAGGRLLVFYMYRIVFCDGCWFMFRAGVLSFWKIIDVRAGLTYGVRLFLLLLLYYTLLFFSSSFPSSSSSSSLSSSHPNIHSIRVDTYIRLFIFNHSNPLI